MTGYDPDDPSRPEIEHLANCPFCGALVDLRDRGQLMAHAHGQEPEDRTGRPKCPDSDQIPQRGEMTRWARNGSGHNLHVHALQMATMCR
jgi:hypothetical protein